MLQQQFDALDVNGEKCNVEKSRFKCQVIFATLGVKTISSLLILLWSYNC